MDTLERTLEAYPISVAIVFGSSVTDDRVTTNSDIDVAVEFEEQRPGDDGYNDLYFEVRRALEDAVAEDADADADVDVDADVDLVDVWSMSPQFATVVFDHGKRLIGTDDRQARLESELAGDPPTVEQARERVAAAATRLRENRS